VVSAYEQLRHEGYLEPRIGAGTYVGRALPDHVPRPRTMAPGARSGPPRRPTPTTPRLTTRSHGGLVPFRRRPAAPAAFPHRIWSRVVAHHARRLAPAHMGYGDPAGLPRLRTAVADHLRLARALRCDPSQVIIVSGSQAALRICAAVLLRAGDR